MEGPMTSHPWWVSLIVIVGAFLIALGAIIAIVNPLMLVPPGSQITEAVRVYAGYLCARNLAIAMTLIVFLALGSRRILSGLMILTALVQGFDAVIDAAESRWILVPAVLFIGIAFAIGALRISGPRFWKD
jgi:hypothetical protein